MSIALLQPDPQHCLHTNYTEYMVCSGIALWMCLKCKEILIADNTGMRGLVQKNCRHAVYRDSILGPDQRLLARCYECDNIFIIS